MQPTRIGPYLVERELGSGGMGTVFLAKHAETGRVAAVKVLPASLSREPGFVARFTREIDALKSVASPQIVELYESGVDGETYFYAMEYVEGETLTARLERDTRLSWREVIDIGVQVCRALKSAHNAGVIHRDLKPSNLLLTPDGQVKLTDFGVAQIFAGGKLTATGGIVGTAEFMAPEQAEGKRATKQSDIYALGAVMYVMLTGRPPFTGKTALDIAQKHRFGQFDSPRRYVADIPSWLDEVVCQCLAKNPDQRYPDAYVLSLRLAEIPRKVDLAAEQADVLKGEADASAETVASNAAVGGVPGAGELGGTFVRDMVRAELDRAASRSMVEHWLDSTWILSLLLAAVLGGGYWLYQRRAVDADQLFAEGESLMQQPDRAEWLRADREFFAPLLALDSAAWEPRIGPFQDQIAFAQSEQEILKRLRRRGDAGSELSEPLRLLDRIAREIESGDIVTARLQLAAFRDVLPAGPDHDVERAIVSDLLERLPPAPPGRENPLALEAFREADRLLAAGRVPDARRIWAGLITLYGDDAASPEVVRRAEQLLQQHPLPAPVDAAIPESP
jgi:predicted Ser/Thr protein kinase